jgi:hypothetical protein
MQTRAEAEQVVGGGACSGSGTHRLRSTVVVMEPGQQQLCQHSTSREGMRSGPDRLSTGNAHLPLDNAPLRQQLLGQ